MEIYKAEDIIINSSVRIIQRKVNEPIAEVFSSKVSGWHYSSLKRLFDVILSFTLIVGLLSWLSLIVGLFIKLNSRGPVLFVQKRIGRQGKVFTCYKFRTMHPNDSSDLIPAQDNDKRITSIGKFLRKTHIDELLQLINILVGDMSFVGPRPHMTSDDRFFSVLLPDYDLRKCIKPGLTGLAQVKGFHGLAPDVQSISGRTKMDIFYIKNASLLFDLRILIATLFTPFSK